MTHYLLLISLGLTTGFISGLLGVGRGLVLVPALLYLLRDLAPEPVLMKSALATSLAVIVVSGAWCSWLQYRAGNVDLHMAGRLSGGATIGAFAGGFLTSFASERGLKIFFLIFVVYMALQMLWPKMPKFNHTLSTVSSTITGAVSGFISSLVGGGGAAILVPFLTMCKVDIHKAIGVATVVGVALAAAASLGYYLSAKLLNVDTPGALGYVNLEVLSLLAITCMVGSVFGVRLNSRVNAKLLKKLFALVLIASAVKMALALV